MKILQANQVAEADRHTIQNEPISSINLMERASGKLFEWFIKKYDPRKKVFICCGTGNNGGDGLALGRMLYDHDYDVQIGMIDKGSPSEDFQQNLQRSPLAILRLEDAEQLPDLAGFDILVDALFGTGLSRPAEGIYARVIEKINDSNAEIIAIDLPSGMFADKPSAELTRVKADHTLTFQVPKLGLLLPENEPAVGEWHLLDIGLDKSFISSLPGEFTLADNELIEKIFRDRSKFSHKGTFGKGLLIAGSMGKMGAAVLSARGALRSGIGLLTVYLPSRGYLVLQTAVPEAMVLTDDGDDVLTGIPEFEGLDAIGIGPGIGQSQETRFVVEETLRLWKKPMVIDADALNIISSEHKLKGLLNDQTILTPHPGEFRRLAGSWENDFERLSLQRAYSKENGVIVILKGAHSSITFPDGRVVFNSTGNPGMATGGSGDVLTGIITSLLAQQYSAEDAAILGVYVHGLAGDLASEQLSQTGLIAGDIIEYLSAAFRKLENK